MPKPLHRPTGAKVAGTMAGPTHAAARAGPATPSSDQDPAHCDRADVSPLPPTHPPARPTVHSWPMLPQPLSQDLDGAKQMGFHTAFRTAHGLDRKSTRLNSSHQK